MLSIFTPTHRDGTYLLEEYQSLKEQTVQEWQWVLIPNGSAMIPDEIAADSRVKIVSYPGEPLPNGKYSIGALKRFACQQCDGDILVELDDDDLLPFTALEQVLKAFQDPQVKMVYSHTAEFEQDTWKSNTFSNWWGWKTGTFDYKGHHLLSNLAWPISAQSLRHIFWSPNHIRCWRALDYWKIGGHNPDLALVDDHDLNIRFYITYGNRGVKLIDDVLYLYRLHPGSTCKGTGPEIMKHDIICYDKYIVPMAERWALDYNLPKIDLGGSFYPPKGYLTVDLRENSDIKADLNGQWPFIDSSVGIVRASHIFEHLKDPIHTMNELYRVLAPGGFAFIEVPSTDGRGAFQDPTHVSFWNQNSFYYYTRQEQAQYIQPQSKARFQVSILDTIFPNQWFKDNNVPCVRAHLICLKPGYEERRAGEVLI